MQIPYLSHKRYRIEKFLGKGGMAAVFLAYDTRLQIHRAVKLLHPTFLLNHKVRERFTQEALSMAQLQHPNVVHVYDHGMEGTSLFLVMEYLPHGSIEQYLRVNGSIPVGQALQVLLDISNGLSYAHQKGYIHRDIKPDNMLIGEMGVQLADFGLVHVSSLEQTQTKAVMGTLAYMPPEQRVSAKKTTEQSDIYALVASFYHMLTGESPDELFDQEHRWEAIAELPQIAQNIIDKGCQESPQDRYASVMELITEIETNASDILECFQPHPISTEISTEEDLLSVWSTYVSSVTSDLDEENIVAQPNTTPQVISKDTLIVENIAMDDIPKIVSMSDGSVSTSTVSLEPRQDTQVLRENTKGVSWVIPLLLGIIAVLLYMVLGTMKEKEQDISVETQPQTSISFTTPEQATNVSPIPLPSENTNNQPLVTTEINTTQIPNSADAPVQSSVDKPLSPSPTKENTHSNLPKSDHIVPVSSKPSSTHLPIKKMPLPSGRRKILTGKPNAKFIYLGDGKNIFAVTFDDVQDSKYLAKPEYSVYWGIGDDMFGLPVISSSRSMEESWSFGFWDSRFPSGYQRQIQKKSDGSYNFQCGEKEYPLDILETEPPKLRWHLSAWARQITMMAKDDNFQYYLIDQNRYPFANDELSSATEDLEYHLFVGAKGNMRQLPIENIDVQYNKYHVQFREGNLIGTLKIEGNTGIWSLDGKETTVENLEPSDQAKMIYTTLGIYPSRNLGTPCDAIFQK